MKTVSVSALFVLLSFVGCNSSSDKISLGPSNDPMWKVDCTPEALTKEFGGGEFQFPSSGRDGIGWFQKGIDAAPFLAVNYNPVSQYTGALEKKIDGGNDIPLPEGLTVFQGNNVEPAVLCQNGKVVAYRDYFTGGIDKLNSHLEDKYGSVSKKVSSYDQSALYEARSKATDKFVMTRVTDIGVLHIYYFKPDLFTFWENEIKKLEEVTANHDKSEEKKLK